MGRRLALLIATYEYEDTGLRRLTSPAHDAEALAAVLRDPSIAGFEVTMLINEPHHRVGEAIGDFYRDRRRDDLTLLYFTGHGLKDDDGRLYLAMTNTLRDNLLFTALSAEQVDQAMERCVSRQKVLVLDCCYSGAFPAGRIAKGDTMVHALERFQGRGRTVLTASDSTQYSFEGGQPHGQAEQSVFTRYLVAGLRDGSADLDGDGDITLDELYSYVHDRVVEEMPQQRPKKQDNVEGRTVIARNINWTLPAYLRNAISSPIATDRLAALDGLAHLYRIGNDVVRRDVQKEIRRLADDDSRQVSAAATTLLHAGLPQRPEPPSSPPGHPADQLSRTPEQPEPAAGPPLETPATRPAPAAASPETTDGPAAPQMTTQPRSTPTSGAAPSAGNSTPSADAAAQTTRTPGAPRAAPPRTTERVTTPGHAGGPAPDQRSGAVPGGRRVNARTVGLAVVALTMTIVLAVFLANSGAKKSGTGSKASLPTATIFAGHSGKVTKVTFSSDGKSLATGADDNTARLWAVATGQTTATLTGVADVEFSPDSKTLAVVNHADKGPIEARMWDVATGRTIATLTGYQGSISMAFSPDSKTLATAGTGAYEKDYDNPVRLWSVATGKMTATLTGHTNGVQSMDFSRDGKTLATGAAGGTVRLWDVATGKTAAILTAGYRVKFSPDGTTLATSSEFAADHTVHLWDVANRKTTATLAEGYPVAFSPDGKTLATARTDDTTVRLWDVATGKTTAILAEGIPMAFSPNGKTLATGAADGTVRMWDVATGKVTSTFTGHTGAINDVAFSPNGTILATAGSDRTARLWHVAG